MTSHIQTHTCTCTRTVRPVCEHGDSTKHYLEKESEKTKVRQPTFGMLSSTLAWRRQQLTAWKQAARTGTIQEQTGTANASVANTDRQRPRLHLCLTVKLAWMCAANRRLQEDVLLNYHFTQVQQTKRRQVETPTGP